MSKLYSVYHEKVSTAYNMQSVSSNAVYNALSYNSLSSSNSNWVLQEGSNGIIIGYCWNSSSQTLSGGGYFIGYVPTGYRVVDVISASAFADGNPTFVMGAVHIFSTGQGVVVYVSQAGTFSRGGFRIVARLTRT